MYKVIKKKGKKENGDLQTTSQNLSMSKMKIKIQYKYNKTSRA
jgi:hypothetical protein